MKEDQKIVIYQTPDGQTQIDVRLEDETVWLTQTQMAQLFKSSRTNILEHIQHIYEVEELEKEATCRNFRQVRQEGKRMVNRTMTMYNLDMIISVGYRVNSKRGVKFRQWANKVLKEYLIKGYVINERIRKEQLGELRQLVQVASRAISNQEVPQTVESQDLLNVVVDYMVTKNHSFSDGNKRIAATLFLWFLNNNGILYREDGSKRLADNTLVALTLMIAESKTEEKDVMVKVVVNLINKNNL